MHTPTLAGCGYLARPGSQKSDLHDYIADIRGYIEFEDLREIILVAHSFSGMVCGALMMQIPERIRHAVFIDAVLPESQQSFTDLAGELFRLMLEEHHLEDGSVKPWPLQVFGVTSPETSWFSARLRPFSYKSFHTPFPEIFDPKRVPASFISCRGTVSPYIQAMGGKAKANGWPLMEINTGHCPMVTAPVNLARTIMIQTAPFQDLLTFLE
ncbi:alpha/beta fold hydrolase [Desulfocastanea catecholica]